ncbi:MAG: hypothetical protein AAGF66_01215 [Cyanobacteria bacterium P01_H01_bin.119]
MSDISIAVTATAVLAGAIVAAELKRRAAEVQAQADAIPVPIDEPRHR